MEKSRSLTASILLCDTSGKLSNFAVYFLSIGKQSITELSNHELKTKTGKKRKLGKKMAQRIYSTLFLDTEIYF